RHRARAHSPARQTGPGPGPLGAEAVARTQRRNGSAGQTRTETGHRGSPLGRQAVNSLGLVRKPGFAPGPSPSQGEMLLVTPQSCWSPWSDSHRRIRVYETRPVAAGGTGAKWRPRQELHLRPSPSRGDALIYLSYADNLRWATW